MNKYLTEIKQNLTEIESMSERLYQSTMGTLLNDKSKTETLVLVRQSYRNCYKQFSLYVSMRSSLVDRLLNLVGGNNSYTTVHTLPHSQRLEAQLNAEENSGLENIKTAAIADMVSLKAFLGTDNNLSRELVELTKTSISSMLTCLALLEEMHRHIYTINKQVYEQLFIN